MFRENILRGIFVPTKKWARQLVKFIAKLLWHYVGELSASEMGREPLPLVFMVKPIKWRGRRWKMARAQPRLVNQPIGVGVVKADHQLMLRMIHDDQSDRWAALVSYKYLPLYDCHPAVCYVVPRLHRWLKRKPAAKFNNVFCQLRHPVQTSHQLVYNILLFMWRPPLHMYVEQANIKRVACHLVPRFNQNIEQCPPSLTVFEHDWFWTNPVVGYC